MHTPGRVCGSILQLSLNTWPLMRKASFSEIFRYINRITIEHTCMNGGYRELQVLVRSLISDFLEVNVPRVPRYKVHGEACSV